LVDKRRVGIGVEIAYFFPERNQQTGCRLRKRFLLFLILFRCSFFIIPPFFPRLFLSLWFCLFSPPPPPLGFPLSSSVCPVIFSGRKFPLPRWFRQPFFPRYSLSFPPFIEGVYCRVSLRGVGRFFQTKGLLWFSPF